MCGDCSSMVLGVGVLPPGGHTPKPHSQETLSKGPERSNKLFFMYFANFFSLKSVLVSLEDIRANTLLQKASNSSEDGKNALHITHSTRQGNSSALRKNE